MFIDACNAGKDVYVEKPLSLTVVEGRKMVEAAARTKRVSQVGTLDRYPRTILDWALRFCLPASGPGLSTCGSIGYDC
jgi:hypothetical protein